MYYAPHILQRVLVQSPVNGMDGNPVFSTDEPLVKLIGKCRCDDNDQNKQISVNGEMVDFSYHIVYSGIRLSIGDEVRAIEKDGSLRGFGIVKKAKKCNRLNYAEIWV